MSKRGNKTRGANWALVWLVQALAALGLGEEALPAEASTGGLRVLDAYCGAGTITLAAAARGACCVGVEIVAPAVENARPPIAITHAPGHMFITDIPNAALNDYLEVKKK